MKELNPVSIPDDELSSAEDEVESKNVGNKKDNLAAATPSQVPESVQMQ